MIRRCRSIQRMMVLILLVPLVAFGTVPAAGAQAVEPGQQGADGPQPEASLQQEGDRVQADESLQEENDAQASQAYLEFLQQQDNEEDDLTRGGAAKPAPAVTIKPVTSAPAADPARDKLIRDSYQAAFGRAPATDELVYWRAVKASDPRVASLSALAENHRKFLQKNADTSFAHDVIDRAFQSAIGRKTRSGTDELLEARQWIKQDGEIYQTMVDRAWRAHLLPIVNGSYLRAYGRPPQPDETSSWLGVDHKDPRIASVETLIADRRQFLSENARTTFADDVIDRAYLVAFGRHARGGQGPRARVWIETNKADFEDIVANLRAQRNNALLAFRRALDRDPTQLEADEWLTFYEGDGSGISTVDQVLDTLRVDRAVFYEAEFDRIIDSAYAVVFGRPPSPDERLGATDWIRHDANLYEDLVERLGRARASEVSSARQLIDFTYRTLMDQEPAPEAVIGRYVDRVVNHQLDPIGLWTEVALSPEREQKYGYFAPARVGYDGVTVRRDGGGKHQQCFGGVGPKCDAVSNTGDVPFIPKTRLSTFQTPDGRNMAWVIQAIDVGSIFHDNSCLRNDNAGTWCTGMGWGLYDNSTDWGSVKPSSLEWRRATDDTSIGAWWLHSFGPYPIKQDSSGNWVLDADDWSDDVRLQPNRSGYMKSHWAADYESGYDKAYTGGETAQTLHLAAPSGTIIEAADPAFCEAKSVTTGQRWLWSWLTLSGEYAEFQVCS